MSDDFLSLAEEFFAQDAPYDEGTLGAVVEQQRDIWESIPDAAVTTFHGAPSFASPHYICPWFQYFEQQPGDTSIKLHVYSKNGTDAGDGEVEATAGAGFASCLSDGNSDTQTLLNTSWDITTFTVSLQSVEAPTPNMAQFWIKSATPRDPSTRLANPASYVPVGANVSEERTWVNDANAIFEGMSAGLENPKYWELVRTTEYSTTFDPADTFRVIGFEARYYEEIGERAGWVINPPLPQWKDGDDFPGFVLYPVDWVNIKAIGFEIVRDTVDDATSSLHTARPSRCAAGKPVSSVPPNIMATAIDNLTARRKHITMDVTTPEWGRLGYYDRGGGTEAFETIYSNWPSAGVFAQPRKGIGVVGTYNFEYYVPIAPFLLNSRLRVMMGIAGFYTTPSLPWMTRSLGGQRRPVDIEIELMEWADDATAPVSLSPAVLYTDKFDVPSFGGSWDEKFGYIQDLSPGEFGMVWDPNSVKWVHVTLTDIDADWEALTGEQHRPYILRIKLIPATIRDSGAGLADSRAAYRIINSTVISER